MSSYSNGDRGSEIHLNRLLEEIGEEKTSSLLGQLKSLKAIFDKNNRAKNLDSLKDKAYHHIYEVIIKVALSEKRKTLEQPTKRGTKSGITSAASGRLEAAADAFRAAVQAGASKLKPKTVKAVIKHVTETLPKPNGGYFEAFAPYYLKALISLFEHEANVERLGTKTWDLTADFCVEGIQQYLDDLETDAPGFTRSFSGLGSSYVSGSLVKSSVGNSRPKPNSVSRQNAEELLSILLALVSIPNSPLLDKSEIIVACVLSFLNSQSSTVSAVYQVAFSILNAVLSFCREDRCSLLQDVAVACIPIICRFWQGKISAKDEMLNSIRDEMLILLFNVHLHLERSILDEQTSDILSEVTALADVMTAEYARRSDKDQLQLDDIDIADIGSTNSDLTPFRLDSFGLRPHNSRGERTWANLQVVGLLERLVSIGNEHRKLHFLKTDGDIEEQPRKRQRTSHHTDRILDPLISDVENLRLAALQVLPFILQACQLSALVLSELLDHLSNCATDKRGQISSWAFLAITSCTGQKAFAEEASIDWIQLWHIGARALTFNATCRAAAAQLHAMLAANLVEYHQIAESVDTIITSADINGPAILCDSSIFLMIHLLNTRVIEVPGTSLIACQHVTRWLFARWNPVDRSFSAFAALQTRPHHITDILRTALGLPRMRLPPTTDITCGRVAQAWQLHLSSQPVVRYLLLLDSEALPPRSACALCPKYSESHIVYQTLDNANFLSTQKLIVELLVPKGAELLISWKSIAMDASSTISLDTFRRTNQSTISMLQLMPHLGRTSLFAELENSLDKLVQEIVLLLRDSDSKDATSSQLLVESFLQIVQPYLPVIGSSSFRMLSTQFPHLLKYFVLIAGDLSHRSRDVDPLASSGDENDDMDVDDDFPTSRSQGGADKKSSDIPRRAMALQMSSGSFLVVNRERLLLLEAFTRSPESCNDLPSKFVEHLNNLDDVEFLLCRQLLDSILHSDLILSSSDTADLLVRFGKFLESDEWGFCEVSHCNCVDLLVGLGPAWMHDDDSEIKDLASQLYHWFVTSCLGKDIASPAVQKSMTNLLLLLSKLDKADTISNLGKVPSPRTTIIDILTKGNATVKFYIGNQLPMYFELFILKDHDAIFVDILDKLPANATWIEGIAFRLYVFARIASKWPTLLRRCVYHIFETPPRIPESTKYATKCLLDVSSVLPVNGPRELFALFAPQILYTWLDRAQDLNDLPFQIFGFDSLKDLLTESQHVAVGLMVMRGQSVAINLLSELLAVSETELVRKCFSSAMAYSIACSMSTKVPLELKGRVMGEAWIKQCIPDDFAALVNLHFVEIIAILFNTIDNGDCEGHFAKDGDLGSSAAKLKRIKELGASGVELPPNQQPMFKAKFLITWIQHMCRRTEHMAKYMFTPALVVFITRKLLNTLHPALGSLHACSVVRKLRVLVSLAGKTALEGYPLEMLLQAISSLISNTECIEDALGLLQYLLLEGKSHLEQNPSFVAGIMLSILGSLRVFMQSRQASTTQDTQHQLSNSKAEAFHKWMRTYISKYNAPLLKGQSKERFHSLVQAACEIGLVGNADVGTYESDLIIRLFEDEQATDSILNEPSRELALAMICSEFHAPQSFRTDVLGVHELSISHAASVLKSCKGDFAGKSYLAWAGRVLGRAFAASGHIHEDLLRESSLSRIEQLSTTVEEGVQDDSRASLLNLLQALTQSPDRETAGLAEVALRMIMTDGNENVLATCSHSISHNLIQASLWSSYVPPPLDERVQNYDNESIADPLGHEAIMRQSWLRDLTIVLARYFPNDAVLRAVIPIVGAVPGFADQVFPFILHLILSPWSTGQPRVKSQVSCAIAAWFSNSEAVHESKLKALINALLYLRTQPIPHEKSTADRSNWLDIDYSTAAVAATNCGMFKTALLFVEEHASAQASAKSSRRSSTIPQGPPTELLLKIFQNIDDPDLFYGVQQIPTLGTIMARLEYEKDGHKSLAFRGAQYDSHIRRQNPGAGDDVQSLVKALDALNLNGLSHSLLQAQQATGMSPASLDSMYRTARKLERWDIPVPSNCETDAITMYKAFQTVQSAAEHSAMLQTIDEGLYCTMTSLVRKDLSASALHDALQTLASLTELDEVISSRSSVQFEELLPRFKERSIWMKTGRFDDISQILSCRGTTLSTLSRQPILQNLVKLGPMDARLVEVQTALLAAEINRSHNAHQESLALATFLIGLVEPCEQVGLHLEVPIRLEAANALWDQGETASSIGMLQGLDNISLLARQNTGIAVGRSDLLSKIGSQVSIARLEKPDRILENYLKPALKELKGKTDGREASQVFYQFALFCDQQLQDADGLEDLERLRKLSENKQAEVDYLDKMIKTGSSRDREKYKSHLSKNKTWLKLDKEELQRHVSSREEFLRECLENYLLALGASDEHDTTALRFSALWLEHSIEQLANEAVGKHLGAVPSRKFAPLMNQLSSRLQDSKVPFQDLLFPLVVRICKDHPFHGMYQIFSGSKNHANSKDDTAVARQKATQKVAKALEVDRVSMVTWKNIHITSTAYCQLAAEKDEHYKSGRKVSLKKSAAATRLSNMFANHPIPPPTMDIPLSANRDYSKVPVVLRLTGEISIASGVSAPKIILASASNGRNYRQLVKGGNDDLRQDAIMEQVFEQVSELLKTNRSTRQRNLSIRTYKVLPLTSIAGIIEFVPNTIPLHEYLMPAHDKYYPKDIRGQQCRKEISEVQNSSVADRVKKFRSVMDRFHPVMRYFFTERFTDPDEWFVKRLAYTRSTAAISILGHVLGLGDRHGHNILLDAQSGEVVHIDLGVAFESGRVLPVPELVPFRLTRDIVDGMGITKTEGVFRRCCEFTLEALRKEAYSIMTILDVLRYDPLYNWSISPVRLGKLQEGQSAAGRQRDGGEEGVVGPKVNEPGEADRALTVVNKKLSKTLSVRATVNDLINQAVDERNLAVLYCGWAAYA